MGGGQSVSALKKAKKKPADAEATRIWTDMDVDNGGTLTVKEIIDALKKNYPDYTASKIKAAVDHFDKDKDGKISRDEVRRLSRRPILLLPIVATHAGTACPVSAVHRSVVCSGDQHRAHQARPEGAEAPVDDQVPSARSRGGGGGGGGATRRRQHRRVDGGTCAACSVHAVSLQCACSARACSAYAGAPRRCYSVCGDHSEGCMRGPG